MSLDIHLREELQKIDQAGLPEPADEIDRNPPLVGGIEVEAECRDARGVRLPARSANDATAQLDAKSLF